MLTYPTSFIRKGHSYYLHNEKVPSVTTVLNVLGKGDALLSWAAKQSVDYLLAHKGEITPEVVQKALKAWDHNREGAAAHGTATHFLAETYINDCIEKKTPNADCHPAIKFLRDWAVEKEITFLTSETPLVSEQWKCAGTTDFIYKTKDGAYGIGDLKTSKSIYPSYFMQCAAYGKMFTELSGNDFSETTIVRVGKDGTNDIQMSDNLNRDLYAFAAALQLFYSMKEYPERPKVPKNGSTVRFVDLSTGLF